MTFKLTQEKLASITAIDDVVGLARALIDVPSVTGNEKNMATVLKSWLTARNWTVKILPVTDTRANVLAWPSSLKSPSSIELLFNSHIDTVPPFFPSSLDTLNGLPIIRGRGACDTKSLIASQLLAMTRLITNSSTPLPIGCLYVIGEEVDHLGMTRASPDLSALKIVPKCLIVGEPTESRPVCKQKGMLKCILTAQGKHAHSGYPETGVCALTPMLKLCTRVQTHVWPAETTVNIGKFKSGVAANVVPPKAVAHLLFRVSTTCQDILGTLKRMIRETAPQIEMEIVAMNDPHELHGVGRDLNPLSSVSYNTDIPYLKCAKAPVPILFGCGDIRHAHTPGEFVKIADLKKSVAIYQDIAMRCLEGKLDDSLYNQPVLSKL